jgi:phosphoglycerate dehydrogenase-like enzyme
VAFDLPRIATLEQFAAELSKSLKTTEPLRTIGNQSDEEIAEMLSRTEVLVSPIYKAAWGAVAKNGTLRLVHSTGAGIDDIDLVSLPPGCRVCNVYGHERGVAEQAFMLVLALQKRLRKLDASLRRGDWTPELPYLSELRQRSLLILGLGHVGAELVRWGRFLDMDMTALTRSPSRERAERLGLTKWGRLDELGKYLPLADFVIVAIPATDETIDLIGEREFEQMKRTAYLINVGRARVVNEEALYNALLCGRIAGAGLDVWYQYPEGSEIQFPSRFPLQELDNVIMTPHKPTVETMEYRWAKIAENIRRFALGDSLENVVYTA